MRPISLELQAFGPYAGYEKIDFEALSSKGLFLVCGETGSGKTMLLDAMTYALYGKSSGHGRDDFAAMRCTNAEGNTATFVKFVFENNRDYYLFERRLELKRTKLSASYNLMKKDEAGIWRTLLENPKDKDLNARAAELIGLEYDQFRQVIVLPQGQFEKLLTSGSDEKEKILTSIFGEEKWQLIANRFYDKCKERNDALKVKRDRIAGSLREENCDTVEDLLLLVAGKETRFQRLSEEYDRLDPDGKIKSLQEEKVLLNRFGDLHRYESRFHRLQDEKPMRDDKERLLEKARRAEKVKPFIGNADSCSRAVSDRTKELEAAAKREEAALIKAGEAARILREHTEKQGDIEEKRNQKILYVSREEDYANIQNSENKCKALKARYAKLEKALEEVREANIRAGETLQAAKSEYERLNNEHTCLLNAYINEISGILARDLSEGMPCPVCGNREHPNPARLSDGSISKESVDAKREESERKRGELDKLTKIMEEGNRRLDELKEESNNLAAGLQVAEAEHKKLLGGLFEGISDLKELKAVISRLEDEIRAYETAKIHYEAADRKAAEALTEARANVKSGEIELEAANTNNKKAGQELAKAISDNGFLSIEEVTANLIGSDRMNGLQKEISEYDAEAYTVRKAIEDISAQLQGKTEPDKDEVDRLLKEANEKRDELLKEKAGLEQEKTRLSEKASSLEREGKGIERDIAESDNDLGFAKALRGDTGTGLQRYVLGIMFSSVISYANRMLESVHDGRYRLFRSDDKTRGSNKKGLELKVHDKYSDDPEGRFVNTLSGGEKFLVSLALSIGMSTVAGKSGIRIEALFIDEGFGSLDENSIADAMNILNGIQEANGLVGIISHVQILRDRIPTKLLVNKSEGRSYIKESIG